MFRRLTACLTVLGLFASLAPFFSNSQAAAPRGRQRSAKLAPEFNADSTSNETVRVVVQTKGRPTAAHDQAINAKHGRKRQTLDSLDAFVAELPKSEVASFATRADVEYVSPDRPVKAQMDVTREATGAALAQAGVAGAQGVTGKGVGIAVIDSGISSAHPDFRKNNKSRVVAARDFTAAGSTANADGIILTDGIVVASGADANGNGTGVAGVAAGSGAASQGYAGHYAGVAPEANLVDLKALDRNGAGTTSAVLTAVNWAVANQRRYNIRVLNLSLGTPVRESYRTDPLARAVARAVTAGIVVVCSAGNNGRTEEIVGHDASGDPVYRAVYGAVNSPGNSPYVITVGATDTRGTARRSDDAVAQFSSKGPTQFDRVAKPDLLAPGRRRVGARLRPQRRQAEGRRSGLPPERHRPGALAHVPHRRRGRRADRPCPLLEWRRLRQPSRPHQRHHARRRDHARRRHHDE